MPRHRKTAPHVTTPASIETPTFQPVDEPAAWRMVLRKVGLVYLYSRICVSVGAAIVAAELRADDNVVRTNFPQAPWADPQYSNAAIPRSATQPMLDVLTSWDGLWYLRIARFGYPRSVQPNVTYDVSDARAAFFPLYPDLVRAVDWLLPGGDTFAALLTNFLLGAAAVLITGLIARELFGIRVGERTMILMAMFPGSFVLSFAYSEALLLVLAAGCLWFLLKRQWLLAGLLAALGTATRPNGIALIAACAAAAFFAIRDRREWKALSAVLLAPVGFVGFQLWLGQHTGGAEQRAAVIRHRLCERIDRAPRQCAKCHGEQFGHRRLRQRQKMMRRAAATQVHGGTGARCDCEIPCAGVEALGRGEIGHADFDAAQRVDQGTCHVLILQFVELIRARSPPRACCDGCPRYRA